MAAHDEVALCNRAALQPAGTLSGAERMREGLACAFAGEPPDLILLDGGALLVVSHDEALLAAIGAGRAIDLSGAQVV